MINVSVILCTHNPRSDYLNRVLSGLRQQTLPFANWELLLVDNASATVVAEIVDLSWHPNGRDVRESALGLTAARLRGLAETAGELIVFVDDDNVLQPDYLACAWRLATEFKLMGAFGGSIQGEPEIAPPARLKEYVSKLGGIPIHRDYWSNIEARSPATPIGAGLCVRRAVADYYAARATQDPLMLLLGRAGQNLFSGEDIDLAWCALDKGLGTGRFRELQLTHLISSKRISSDYIVRLYAGYAASGEILAAIRPHFFRADAGTLRRAVAFCLQFVSGDSLKREILLASRKARRDARILIRQARRDRMPRRQAFAR